VATVRALKGVPLRAELSEDSTATLRTTWRVCSPGFQARFATLGAAAEVGRGRFLQWGFEDQEKLRPVLGCCSWGEDGNLVLPVEVRELTRTASIVGQLGALPCWEAVSAQLLFDTPGDEPAERGEVPPRELWSKNKTLALDLTTNVPRLEKVSRLVAEALIVRHKEMMQLIVPLMEAMGINQLPSLGIARPGHVTERHQHFCGVFNLLKEGGAKVWHLWPPWAESKATSSPDMLTVEQRAGDVLWLPPGWWHEVATTGTRWQKTTVAGEKEAVCLHFTAWVMPAHLAEAALAGFRLPVKERGSVREKQMRSGPVPAKLAARVKRLIELYVAADPAGAPPPLAVRIARARGLERQRGVHGLRLALRVHLHHVHRGLLTRVP
jgi:hypothetical protein